MAAPYYDYILADDCIVPSGNERYFSEKIVYLPATYMPSEAQPISARIPTRAALGLPENGFVFASFNNAYKFSPDIFDVWMGLLRRIEASVLWLAGGNAVVERNLKREAVRRGVDASRLIFAPYAQARDEYFVRLQQADLFLDTLPCNAHTTACDALWAGLPLLTCPGNTFAGRVAASLLRALDMPELIAADGPAYEAMALEFARDAKGLRRLREKLWRNRTKGTLFDAARMSRSLEAAYAVMVEKQKSGLAPASFAVSSDI